MKTAFPLLFLLCGLWLACDDSTPSDDNVDQTPDESQQDTAQIDTADVDGLLFPQDFVFGAATAAHQIEGGNTNNNWYQFETLDRYAGQTAEPSGEAVNSWELWQTDNQLVEDTHLQSYRFSVEWSRIMPQRGVFDEDAIAHYRAIIEDLNDRGIDAFVTLHHFTDPIWVQDLDDPGCEDGPSDTNLCGWTNPAVIDSFVEFAERMADEYGDLVDGWTTFNEPNTVTNIGYFLAIHAPGNPDGGLVVPTDQRFTERVAPVARAFTEAHVRAYDAIKAHDTIDADGDGNPAVVGWTVSTQYMVPADPDNARHVAAVERYREFLNYLYVDAVAEGVWDPDFDGEADEEHPEWVGKQDFIGVQYYSRVFVLNFGGEILNFAPCFDVLADLFSSCPEIDENNQSAFNEIYPEGLYEVLAEFAERFPGVPLPVTENGAAANNGERKAQIMVRHLAQVHRAIEAGLPVTSYYAWSLTDNFEWAEGFEARFGLYEVDFDTYERTPTAAQQVLADVAGSRVLSDILLDEYQDGPLIPDTHD